MKHINTYKIFEKIKEIDGEIEIDAKISDEMKEKIITSYNFIKTLNGSSSEIKIGDVSQAWWDPKYGGKVAWYHEHESFKISVYFRVGLSEYFVDNKSHGVIFPMPEDTSKYLNDFAKLLKETDVLVKKLKPYGDIKVHLIDDEMSCMVYVVMDNEDIKSTRDTKVRRLSRILDEYFNKSDNDHSSKSMIIFQPYPGKDYSTGKENDKVRDRYKDIYEILCDLESLKEVWNPDREMIKLRHTYVSKIEGESIIIRFSPIKYKKNDDRIKPLVIDDMYKNMMNVEISKVIKNRILDHYSSKDLIKDFDITSKGDQIKITLK
jgi:hypothetical protein